MILAPERARQHAVESRMYVQRIVLRSSGQRREAATQIVNTLNAAIKQRDLLIANDRR